MKELLADIKLAEGELEKLELASKEKEEEAPGEEVQEQAGEPGSAAEPGDDILENPDN